MASLSEPICIICIFDLTMPVILSTTYMHIHVHTCTVQLRYKRTSHTRIIRAYFAYSRMSIRAHTRVYTRVYVRIYARIYVSLLFIPTSFFVGQTEQASGFNAKFAYWENVNESSSFRSLRKFTDKLPFINIYLIYTGQEVKKKIETVA